MFMISKFMYEAVCQPRNFLTIDPRSEENHISNFYYFRIGAQNVDGKPEITNAPLRIPKNGFVTV